MGTIVVDTCVYKIKETFMKNYESEHYSKETYAQNFKIKSQKVSSTTLFVVEWGPLLP